MSRIGKLARALIASIGLSLLASCAPFAAPSDISAAGGPVVSGSLVDTPVAVEVAPGVYMFRGAAGEVGVDNLGRIGNAGFIIGTTGVLAIDTGTSYRHGVALLTAIQRVSDKPVRLVIVTHARQEFLFGATAFRERGIPVHMHQRAAALMQSRCDRCLKTLNQLLGSAAMQGTAMFRPDVEFSQSHTIDAIIGRRVQVLHFGHSSGPGDTAILDVQSGVLFAGGLLDQLRIPDVQDSDLDGWSQALQTLRELPIKIIVPGHGPAASVQLIDTTTRYLAQLQRRVMALLQAGAALSEVPDAAALVEFAEWDQYGTTHRRNASMLFVRFEREQWLMPADLQSPNLPIPDKHAHPQRE